MRWYAPVLNIELRYHLFFNKKSEKMNALISAGIGLASNLIGSAFGRKQGDKSAEKTDKQI